MSIEKAAVMLKIATNVLPPMFENLSIPQINQAPFIIYITTELNPAHPFCAGTPDSIYCIYDGLLTIRQFKQGARFKTIRTPPACHVGIGFIRRE